MCSLALLKELSGVVLVLFTAVLLVAAPARALGSRPGQPPDSGQNDAAREALIQKLAANPKVKRAGALRKAYAKGNTARLIVSFDPPGAMAGYATKEERVKAALDRFIKALSPRAQAAVVLRFKTIYAFVVEATPDQLSDILEMQDVNSVEEDAKAKPLSGASFQ